MGTSAPPARGYADDQRIENWDSAKLYNNPLPNMPSPFGSGWLDVGRWGYLMGDLIMATGAALVTFQWALNPDGTEIVGQRSMVIVANIAQGAQMRFLNLGPFVAVNLTMISGSWSGITVKLWASNRPSNVELQPANPLLIDQQAIPLAAGASSTVYPSDYYAGPVDGWLNASGAGFQQQLQWLTAGNVWNPFLNLPTTAGAADLQSKYVVPATAWRHVLSNFSGVNGTYYLNVRQSQTGST